MNMPSRYSGIRSIFWAVIPLFYCGSAFPLEEGDKSAEFYAGYIYTPSGLLEFDDWYGVYEQDAGTIRMKLSLKRDGKFLYSYDADRSGSEKSAEKHSFILLTSEHISIIDMKSHDVITYRKEIINNTIVLLSEAELVRIRLAGDEEREMLKLQYIELGRVKDPDK